MRHPVLRAHLRNPFAMDAILDDQHTAVGRYDLSKTLFRISTMGELSSADIGRLVDCFSRLPE